MSIPGNTSADAELLTPLAAAEFLGVAAGTLASSRCRGVGIVIPYVKVGRLVRYRKADLIAFLAENLVGSAASTGKGDAS